MRKAYLFVFAWGIALAAQAQFSMEAKRAAEEVDAQAVRLMSAQRLEEALPLLVQAVDLWDAAMGQYSPHLYRALGNLQSAYYQTRRYADMHRVMERRLEVARALFGERHEQTLLCMRNVAMGLEALGRHAEARKMRAQAAQNAKN